LLSSSPNFSKRQGNTALLFLAAALLGFSGCEQEKPPAALPQVEVVGVVQEDVPITREWVTRLTGLINAQIRAQVSGYLLKQLYINGTYVKKGSLKCFRRCWKCPHLTPEI
jgi:membrane fusion protein, multidrug efflux system